MITIDASSHDSVNDASYLASLHNADISTSDLYDRVFWKLHYLHGDIVAQWDWDISAVISAFLLATAGYTVEVVNLHPVVTHDQIMPILMEAVMGRDYISIFRIDHDRFVFANLHWNNASKLLLKARKFNPVLVSSRACYRVDKYGIDRFFVDHNRI